MWLLHLNPEENISSDQFEKYVEFEETESESDKARRYQAAFLVLSHWEKISTLILSYLRPMNNNLKKVKSTPLFIPPPSMPGIIMCIFSQV